jgi:hypothetical protein
MRKTTWLLLIAILSTMASLGIASAGGPCPDPSHNPGATPPNCGHRPSNPATTCSQGGLGGSGTILNKDKNENGQVSGPIHTQLEPAVDGLAPVVHEVNCDVVVSLGL